MKKIKWSKYQTDIFDFIKNGNGNAVIEACAGAGKTSTILECLKLIDESDSIMLSAFNKEIAEVLKKKTKKLPNVKALTIHSLGLQMLYRNFRDSKLEIDAYKYKSYVRNNISKLSSSNILLGSWSDTCTYLDNIDKLINFGRSYLYQTIEDLATIADKYDITIKDDEKTVAIKAIEWGKKHIETIDFIDMVALPNYLMLNPKGLKYDWIFVDEAQDLSVAQRETILKCRKINTRLIFTGDKNQCLYAFMSADPNSFEKLKEIPNTTVLPLSISYRCADTIVNYAQKFAPTIECNSDKRVGIIEMNSSIDGIKNGDMVLCRNNAPLIKLYGLLLSKGKKAFIKGKDIGNNLINIVSTTNKKKLFIDLKEKGVFSELYLSLIKERNKLMINKNISKKDANNSSIIESKWDQIQALEIIANKLSTTKELTKSISSIFSDTDKNTDGIMLSTVHKAKGLEADRVFIACNSLMPSKTAKEEWEKLQENNLMYVAYTRPKNFLGFLAEDDFKQFTSNKNDSKFDIIENKICSLYNLKRVIEKHDVEKAKLIIENATKISPSKSSKQIISIKDAASKKKTSNTIMLNNKRIIKRK